MYCPKCGVENQEDMAYCRSCGDDLKIIAQAMKKHLPFTLVSKLDAAIDRKNERLRRDAIINGFSGVTLIILAILGFSFSPGLPIVLGGSGVFLILSGVWSYLTYRRSLELKIKSLNMPVNNASTFDISQVETQTDITGILPKKFAAEIDFQDKIPSIYCPNCGDQHSAKLPYCRTCGCVLDFSISSRGLKKYLPAFIVRRLDAVIAKNEKAKPQYKNGWLLIIGIFTMFLGTVMTGVEGEWLWMIFLLIASISTFIIGGWDFVAYRRSLEKDKQLFELSSTERQDTLPLVSAPQKSEVELEARTQRHLTPINAEDKIGQFSEAKTQRELQELTRTEAKTKPLSD